MKIMKNNINKSLEPKSNIFYILIMFLNKQIFTKFKNKQ